MKIKKLQRYLKITKYYKKYSEGIMGVDAVEDYESSV